MRSIFHWDTINTTNPTNLSRLPYVIIFFILHHGSPCSDNVQGEMRLALCSAVYPVGCLIYPIRELLHREHISLGLNKHNKLNKLNKLYDTMTLLLYNLITN